MFQMLGLIAEFERSMIRGRVVSGMARARITGTKSGRAIGRPAITDVTRDAICRLLGAGQSERAIVQQLGVSKGAVGRVRAAMAAVAPQQLSRHEGSQGTSNRQLGRGYPRPSHPPPEVDGTQGWSAVDGPGDQTSHACGADLPQCRQLFASGPRARGGGTRELAGRDEETPLSRTRKHYSAYATRILQTLTDTTEINVRKCFLVHSTGHARPPL